MSAPYSTQAAVNYNSNPPADDGSTSAANQVKWSTIKTKLNDPVKVLADAVNAQTLAAFGKITGGASTASTGVSYAIVSGDQGKLLRATASGITITFPDATAVGAPFTFSLLNSSSGNVTLAGASAQTINGSATIVMASSDGYQVFTDGTNWFVTGRKTGTLPRGYIDGCICANGADTTNDITIAAGVCRDSTNTVDITVAAMTTGKQLDANWAPGDAAGMRNSAVGIANTTYHIYAVAKADGTQDIYAHTSTTIATVITALQAESGGSAYLYARLIFSIIRASAAILQFVQYTDDLVLLKTPIAGPAGAVAPGTSARTEALTVPLGIKFRALFNVEMNVGSVYVSSLDQVDLASAVDSATAPAATMWDAANGTATQAMVVTDTSAQFRYRCSGNNQIIFVTLGWWHPRGRDA